jgi:hypothetical protein
LPVENPRKNVNKFPESTLFIFNVRVSVHLLIRLQSQLSEGFFHAAPVAVHIQLSEISQLLGESVLLFTRLPALQLHSTDGQPRH